MYFTDTANENIHTWKGWWTVNVSALEWKSIDFVVNNAWGCYLIIYRQIDGYRSKFNCEEIGGWWVTAIDGKYKRQEGFTVDFVFKKVGSLNFIWRLLVVEVYVLNPLIIEGF